MPEAALIEAPEAAAVWVDIGQLRPWAKNPRMISPEAIARVAESIKRFGFGAPLVARTQDGEVIAGHTRLAAAQMLKLTRVPVRFLDLDPAEAHLLALADNRLTELTPWNDNGLQAVLSEYSLADVALAGWNSEDLEELADDLLKKGTGDSPSEVSEDEVPEPPADPITKPGDIWELGDHRLICGDATHASTYSRLMAGQKAKLMATDPPYGVEAVGGCRDPRSATYASGGRIANDELKGPKLEKFLSGAFEHAVQQLDAGAAWYVWFAGGESQAFLNATELLGGFKHMLVWVKPNFVFGRSDYHYRHEPCLYGWVPGAGHTWRGSRNQSTVWEHGRDDAVGKKVHPTVKPVVLYSVPIENHLEKGEIVLDPFSGSGPAFSAAQQTERRCYGSELSPAYCDVIVERWQNLTSGKATRSSP